MVVMIPYQVARLESSRLKEASASITRARHSLATHGVTLALSVLLPRCPHTCCTLASVEPPAMLSQS